MNSTIVFQHIWWQ